MRSEETLVRSLVECWHDASGVARAREHVTSDYVHHTAMGDWSFDQWQAGMAWVDSVFADRAYTVQHVLVDGDRVAAYVRWVATRRSDGSRVEGAGAYHCRLEGGLVAEDWDVFAPMS
ncbi:MAG TPA: nuclear transport factor 2 family protein [Actinomycetes bacterium]|nr:nuclear transport factor 2 family protein [Actinomycetes bacterium]